MSKSSQSSGGTGPSHRSVEIGVALFMALLAVIGIVGSLQVGIGWAAEGPRAGFFPFYVSLIVLISCAVNLCRRPARRSARAVRGTGAQLRQVLAVVIPTTVYVFAVPVLGMYVSSGLLIGVFMKWLGRYGWLIVLAGRHRRAGGHLSHVRELVPGAAAEGAAGRLAWSVRSPQPRHAGNGRSCESTT